MKSSIEHLKEGVYKYVNISLALIIVVWLMTLYELIFTYYSGNEIDALAKTLMHRFTNDYWAVFIFLLLGFPIFAALEFLKKKAGVITIKLLVILMILGQFSLIKYSLTTFLNLGSDLIGYSMEDIKLTVSSSESMSVLSFLPFLIFPLLFFGVYYFFLKKSEKKISYVLAGLFLLAFGSLKLSAFDVSEAKYQNKMGYLIQDIRRFYKEKDALYMANLNMRKDYPLLRPVTSFEDVLSPFFTIKEEKPNIVFIVVEGLGSEFVGDKNYAGFTPFLDSIKSESLYWENFISTTSRTFGVMPSILGSLPFGEKGFLEIKDIPSHISLISILKANGYTTSFFAGHQTSFDRKLNFFEYNGIDHIIDENKYSDDYIKTEANDGGFAWGYPDAEIFRKKLASLDDIKQPRLDIVLTLTNHEPFDFPGKQEFMRKGDSILNSGKRFKVEKALFENNMNIFSTLLYCDTAIRDYIEGYKQRPEYENTIFIITGDHRLVPIPQKDKLCRYHVPFFIYSPLLKRTETFKSISSHFDIAPSLTSFLMNNYKFNPLDEVSWLGNGIDTVQQFRNIHQIPLMRYKGKISDFIYGNHFYSDGELFEINERLGTHKIIDEDLSRTLGDSLQSFKILNSYVTQQNRIFPDSLNVYVNRPLKFTASEQEKIASYTKDLNFDEVFMVARDLAFDKKYKDARLICNYILNELPNHSDARTLKGRTLAWEGKYKESEYELKNVVNRSPYYPDVYQALMDLYWWSGQDEKSIELYDKVIKNDIETPEITFKMAKAFKRLDNLNSAETLIDSLLMLEPANVEFQSFKQSLK